MKSIKDIENMSMEQLEAVSMDEGIAVPEGFAERLHDTLDAQKVAADLGSSNHRIRFMAAVASAAVLLAVGSAAAYRYSQPKDTFDDPYLAYAELEKAFARMSDTITTGLAMAEQSEQIIDKATSIFE